MSEMMLCTNLCWRAANSVGGCFVAVCRTHAEGSDRDVLLRLPQGFTMLQIRDVLRTQGSQCELTNTGTSVFKLTYASFSTPLTIEFQYSSPSRVTTGLSDQTWYPALDPWNPGMFTVSRSISTGPFRPWEPENELNDRQLNLSCSLCFSHVNSAVKPCQILREFDIHSTGQTWKVFNVPSSRNKRNI
jgi:hypothetical protein